MTFNEAWEMVAEFHRGFYHPVRNSPAMISPDRAQKRYKWMLEEINEFIDADTLVDQADAMIDLMYFALGTLVEMGVKPEKLFAIVHEANMSKLWPDGTAHYNDDGKTIKPPNWADPYQKIQSAIAEMKDDQSE
jgi:predicted HAD superfamily Cof-like phosphohydrolase